MTKEERDDRSMLAVSVRRARPKAERFDRPLRRHFEVVINLTLGSASGRRLSEKEVELKDRGVGKLRARRPSSLNLLKQDDHGERVQLNMAVLICNGWYSFA